jgi:GT2 family glycosyltransferase
MAAEDSRATRWLRALRQELLPGEVSLRVVPRGTACDLIADDIPGGWHTLELELAPGEHRTLVYVDEGAGFVPKRRVPLAAPSGGVSRTVLLLVPGTQALRLDPAPKAAARARLVRTGKLRSGATLLRPRVEALLNHPETLSSDLQDALQLLRSGGIPAARQALMNERGVSADLDLAYGDWVARFDTLTDEDRTQIRARLRELAAPPLLSLVMSIDGEPEWLVRRALDAIRTQLYERWELILVESETVRALLPDESRVRWVTADPLAHAQGEHVAFLSPDLQLSEHALFLVANELAAHPDADLLYSDEDVVDVQGRRSHPTFKPDWNPELLWSTNYVGQLSVFRTQLVREVGPGPALALRVAGRSARIRHIPQVLCHRAAPPPPTDPDIELRAVREALPLAAEVSKGPLEGAYRIALTLPEPRSLVSLVIPTRDRVDLLRRCVTSIREKTDYAPFELVVVDNQSTDPETLAYLSRLEQSGEARVLRYDRPFNYSALNNWAVEQTHGEVIGLLNNDLEVIEPGWLTELVSHAVRPDVGAVGAKLLYPDGTIQHAGMIAGLGGAAEHIYRGAPRDHAGHGGRALLLQELTIVTAACLVVRRDAYAKVGGLDERLAVAFNDVDFCLKLRAAGYRNLWTPFALLYHYESASRGQDTTPEKRARFLAELSIMKARWRDALVHDPFYNPNLAVDSDQMELGWPTGAPRMWRG